MVQPFHLLFIKALNEISEIYTGVVLWLSILRWTFENTNVEKNSERQYINTRL
jgi:hypothetical protein